MLLTILTRMSNDEQRVRLLQTLRNRLINYNLDWLDIRKIVCLFSNNEQIRFDILQFLLFYLKNLTKKINIDDYIDLSNQCTNNNEQLKLRLFEQMYEKLNIENPNDFQRITDLFHTVNTKQKIEAIIRDLHFDQQKVGHIKQFCNISFQLASPVTSSSLEQLSVAPLKRKCSFDNESCRQILTPSLIVQHDEFIQQRDMLSSSNSSLSSASDENIPIRTPSFMIAIKKTFERLKESSSCYPPHDDQKANV